MQPPSSSEMFTDFCALSASEMFRDFSRGVQRLSAWAPETSSFRDFCALSAAARRHPRTRSCERSRKIRRRRNEDCGSARLWRHAINGGGNDLASLGQRESLGPALRPVGGVGGAPDHPKRHVPVEDLLGSGAAGRASSV